MTRDDSTSVWVQWGLKESGVCTVTRAENRELKTQAPDLSILSNNKATSGLEECSKELEYRSVKTSRPQCVRRCQAASSRADCHYFQVSTNFSKLLKSNLAV